MGDLEALAPQLGDALRFHDPIAVDGVPVSATITPRDEDDLSAVLEALGEARCAAIPLGAGTQLGLGNAPQRADCFLSLAEFSHVDELDASEGVCHAGAGTPLAELRARVREAGWELPLDDADRGGTLGGALATAARARIRAPARRGARLRGGARGRPAHALRRPRGEERHRLRHGQALHRIARY